nr:hypothetical protein [Morchella crassipes]
MQGGGEGGGGVSEGGMKGFIIYIDIYIWWNLLRRGGEAGKGGGVEANFFWFFCLRPLPLTRERVEREEKKSMATHSDHLLSKIGWSKRFGGGGEGGGWGKKIKARSARA